MAEVDLAQFLDWNTLKFICCSADRLVQGRFIFLGKFVFGFTKQFFGGIDYILDLLGIFIADVNSNDE